MANYMEILGAHFPGVEAHIVGDPSIYDNIIWKSSAVAKSELDAFANEIILDPTNVKQFTYGDADGNPLRTKSKTFTRVRSFQCEGSDYHGTPQEIRFTAWVDDGASGEVRLYDVTNQAIICSTTITNTTEDIVAEATISNWPSTLALIEVQLRNASGNSKKYAYVSGMVLAH